MYHHVFTGVLNCTNIYLESDFVVDGTLSIIENPFFYISLYQTGIFQSKDESFTVEIRSGATLRLLVDAVKGVTLQPIFHLQGFLIAKGTVIKMDESVVILNGTSAVLDVSNTTARAIRLQETKSVVIGIQGIICGPMGSIQLPIQNNYTNQSEFFLSPSCAATDPFPSILSIKQISFLTLQTRFRNNQSDMVLMTRSNNNVSVHNTAVFITTASFDDNFDKTRAVWQVFEGLVYDSQEIQDYNYEVQCAVCNALQANVNLGQFSNSSGVFVYNRCLQNSSNACIMCGAGSMMIGSKCEVCKPGFFSQNGHPNSCKACMPGYFSKQEATMCTMCPAGTFSHSSGTETCSKCKSGTACSVTGCSQCTVCDEGKFADVEGFSQCKVCQPGYARNRTMTADQCYPCPAGW